MLVNLHKAHAFTADEFPVKWCAVAPRQRITQDWSSKQLQPIRVRGKPVRLYREYMFLRRSAGTYPNKWAKSQYEEEVTTGLGPTDSDGIELLGPMALFLYSREKPIDETIVMTSVAVPQNERLIGDAERNNNLPV